MGERERLRKILSHGDYSLAKKTKAKPAPRYVWPTAPPKGKFAILDAAGTDTRYRVEYGYESWTPAQLERKPSDWDDFYDFAFNNVPKLASIIVQNAEMAAGFTWVAKTEDTAPIELLENLCLDPDVLLRPRIVEAMILFQKYGRTYLDPVWSTGGKKLRLKLPDPKTLRPIRDNDEDLRELRKVPDLSDRLKEYEARNIGTLLGFVQTLGQKKKFIAPRRLIFIPRYPQPDEPNGVSVFRAMYKVIVNKLGIEDTQGKMARRHTDPPRIFVVGNDRIPCRPDESGQAMIDFVKNRITEAEGGQDIFIPDWVKVTTLEYQARGIPEAVTAAQRHFEENSVVGAGSFPALLTAEGYRASAAEVRGLLEFKINPMRETFQAHLTSSIIKPYLDANLGEGKYEMPIWVWRDITPEDMNAVRDSLAAAYQSGYMDANDARLIHGGLRPWTQEKVEKHAELKQASKRQDRLEAPTPALTKRVTVRRKRPNQNGELP